MHVFKIICGDRITHIQAKTRAEAMEKFAEIFSFFEHFANEKSRPLDFSFFI